MISVPNIFAWPKLVCVFPYGASSNQLANAVSILDGILQKKNCLGGLTRRPTPHQRIILRHWLCGTFPASVYHRFYGRHKWLQSCGLALGNLKASLLHFLSGQAHRRSRSLSACGVALASPLLRGFRGDGFHHPYRICSSSLGVEYGSSVMEEER